MKKTLALFVAVFICGSIATQTANADYRNVKVHTTGSYLIEYSFGNILTNNIVVGRPAGGWSPLPFSIKKPAAIIGSHDFSQTLPYTSTDPIALVAGSGIMFDLEISTNDMSISSSKYAAAASADVELVDATTGLVLATMYSYSTLAGAAWVGSPSSQLGYTIPASLDGKNAYVRLNVTPDAQLVDNFDLCATDYVDGLAYFALDASLAKSSTAVVANDVLLNNAPNPVSSFTTIQVKTTATPVSLKVYDAVGREVADLSSALSNVNTVLIPFDATSLRSGVYFYRLQTDAGTVQRQMIVRK